MGLLDILGAATSATPVGTAVDAVAGIATGLTNHFFPDKNQEEKDKIVLEMTQLMNAQALALGQLNINSVEAASTNWFIAGWRPAAGWVGVIALALVYWPKAIVLTLLWSMQAVEIVHMSTSVSTMVIPAFPDLGVTDLLGLLGSML